MTEKNERRLELILGRRVRAQDGRVVGRIEDFRAEREHGYYVITEFLTGPAGLLERLAMDHLPFIYRGGTHGYRIRWDQLDLTDADHPRITCPVDELERIGGPRRGRTPHAA